MCLTIPAKVLHINNFGPESLLSSLTVEDSRGVKEIKALSMPDLRVGDWVLYAYDTAVRKVDEEAAREIIELLEPRKYTDLSQLDSAFVDILKSHSTRDFTRDELVRLLGTEDREEMDTLFSEANTIRQVNLKDFFCIHGIIEFSNNCVRDCCYCGLRRSSGDVKRYRMTPDEIIDAVEDSVNRRGYKLIVLQSGDDFYYTDEMLIEILKEIKKRCKVFIFMSVGERSIECYKAMKAAGASGVLFRFETSNRDIYNSIHPGQSFERRMELLNGMKKLGYYIASGFLVGLQGQTVGDIADDIITMKRIGVNMVTVGPFIPCDGTPLASHPAGNAMMALKVTAVSRLMMPRAKIPVTTALETIESEEGRRLGLSSGANSLMFNLTPERYRGDYRIYPNKYHGREEVWEKYGLFKEELSYKMLETKMFEEFEVR